MKKTIMAILVVAFLFGATGNALAKWNGHEYAYEQEGEPLRDGSCQDTLESAVEAPANAYNWGPGPAPSAGDGESEGPEWPDW